MDDEILKHLCDYSLNLNERQDVLEVKCKCGKWRKKFILPPLIKALFQIEKIKDGPCSNNFFGCGNKIGYCNECREEFCQNCSQYHKDHLISNAIFFSTIDNSQSNNNYSGRYDERIFEKIKNAKSNLKENYINVLKKTIEVISQKKLEMEELLKRTKEQMDLYFGLLDLVCTNYKRTNDKLLYDKICSIYLSINLDKNVLNLPEISVDKMFNKKYFEDLSRNNFNFNMAKRDDNIPVRIMERERQVKVNTILPFNVKELNYPLILLCDSGVWVTKEELDGRAGKCIKLKQEPDKTNRSYKYGSIPFQIVENDVDKAFFFVGGEKYIEIHKFNKENDNISIAKLIDQQISSNSFNIGPIFPTNNSTLFFSFFNNYITSFNYGDEYNDGSQINQIRATKGNIIAGIKLKKEESFIFADDSKTLTFFIYKSENYVVNDEFYEWDIDKKIASKNSLYEYKENKILYGFEGGVYLLQINQNYHNCSYNIISSHYDGLSLFNCFAVGRMGEIYCGLNKRGILLLKVESNSNTFKFTVQKRLLENSNNSIDEIYYRPDCLVFLSDNVALRYYHNKNELY